MYRFWSLRVGLLLACILGCQASSAQQSYDNGVREVPIGKDAFTVAEPTPGWVDQLPIPRGNNAAAGRRSSR